jgi:predicted transcriptional regulator YdeE
MEFQGVLSKRTLLLVGMNFYGDPFDKAASWHEENAIGELWKRFYAFLEKNPDAILHQAPEAAFYEVHLITDDSLEKGFFDIFAGVMVDKLEGIPLSLVAKELPATEYAHFILRGVEIISDWQQHMLGCLDSAGLTTSYEYSVLRYDEHFKGIKDIANSRMDVYVPVKKAGMTA